MQPSAKYTQKFDFWFFYYVLILSNKLFTSSHVWGRETSMHTDIDWPLLSRAICRAWRDICGLISSWHTNTFAFLMAGRACCSSSLPSSMLAPATITIAFSPGHPKRCKHTKLAFKINVSQHNNPQHMEFYEKLWWFAVVYCAIQTRMILGDMKNVFMLFHYPRTHCTGNFKLLKPDATHAKYSPLRQHLNAFPFKFTTLRKFKLVSD